MYLEEYYVKCRSGEIVVGREMMLCLDGLVQDIEDPQYRFDAEKAHKRIKFIETQCRHSISPFAGKPFLLELWEKAFIEAVYGFYLCDSESEQWVRRFTDAILVVGRKNGKTSLCAALGNAEFFCGQSYALRVVSGRCRDHGGAARPPARGMVGARPVLPGLRRLDAMPGGLR